MNGNPGNKNYCWIMLVLRTVLFITFQCLLALIISMFNRPAAWEKAASAWPLIVIMVNLSCIILLVYRFKRQGKRYMDLFKISKTHLKQDLLIMLPILITSALISILPNIGLAQVLFGDPQAAMAFMLRPLPLWAAWISLLLFPLTQGLAELPTYFAYVMPRLQEQGYSNFWALSLPAVFLSVQHIGIPFLLDSRYILLRMVMFLPFAFFLGIILRWRPWLMPYLAIMHVLMDASLAVMLLPIAY